MTELPVSDTIKRWICPECGYNESRYHRRIVGSNAPPCPGVPVERAYVAVDAQAKALSGLSFLMERSRPIWRNTHTGKEVRVLDLAVDDDGGFQGGCRRFVVVTDEPLPPGPPRPGQRDTRAWSLDQWLLHWEPTGRYDPVVPGT